MAQDTDSFAFTGGLDLVTRPIAMPKGRCIAASNYESAADGYQRVDGFERFDGQPKPSEASYWVISFDAGDTEVQEGDVVEGATSGATGKALQDAVLLSGTYGGADAAGYLVLTTVSGTFQDDEDLEVSSSKVAEADGVATELGADNDTNDATWLQDAIETARALIAKPTGSGPIRGVWVYDGVTYAFRDNAGATAGVMHKSTAAGWAAVDLGLEIDFTSGGTTEIEEGDTIVGATSGAEALVERVVHLSGTWAGGDAAGYLVLSGQTGTFQSENLNIDGGASNVATIAGDTSAIALSAGGDYFFVNENFFGASNLRRMYGCNGVDRGFEFDGSVFVFIRTGMVVDKPKRVAVHKSQLFFAFDGGSLQHSGIGTPYNWTVVLGAAELGVGEDITDIVSEVAGVLIVFGRTRIKILYGNDSSDWNLQPWSDKSGAIAKSAQRIGEPYFIDSIGVRSLSTTQRYGDFQLGSVSRLVEPLFRQQRKAGLTIVGTLEVSSKDTYRLYWSDGSGLSIYFGNKTPECMPFLLDRVFTCMCSGKDANGDEVLFSGDGDGWVYQLDVGTSFDGEEVEAYIRLPANHLGSPTREKTFYGATLEAKVLQPSDSIYCIPDFSYGDPDQPSGDEVSLGMQGGGGFWDSVVWDQFYWSQQFVGVGKAHIDGIGTNISIAILSESTYEKPHTLQGLTIHYSMRGLKR